MRRSSSSLKLRVGFGFAAFGAMVSLLLAGGLYFAARDLGQRLIDETLHAELDDYMARRTRNPSSLPPATATIRGYVVNGSGEVQLPDQLRELAIGHHDVTLEAESYRVAVAERGGERFYMLYNESRQQEREQRFVAYLAVGVLVMTLLSAGVGRWLAGRVIAPVTELARIVGQADPAKTRVEHLPADEVGEAVEKYLNRLYGFIDRERSFTADVSHELRTPVAIIQGAVEIIREDANLNEAQRTRFERIDRAAGEMAQLIRALLLLAREQSPERPTETNCNVAEVVRDSVEKHRYLLRDKATDVEMAITAEPRLAAEPVLLSIVIGNLIRNAFSFTEGGRVMIVLEGDRLAVTDTGRGIGRDELRHVFRRYYRGGASQGTGIGLSLVKRICDVYGWSIAIESSEGHGTCAELSFASRLT